MTRYPVLNLLAQAPSDRISVGDFDAFHQAALSAISDVAGIARAHDLTPEEENAVRTAMRKLEGYTIAMTPCPAQPLVQAGFPWWAAGLAGLAVGVALIHFTT